MRICFWISSIFTLGGTRKIVTLLANELAKDNEVFIFTPQSRKAEDRELYGMNDDVTVLFYETEEFFRGMSEARRAGASLLRTLNGKAGILNHRLTTNQLSHALYPKGFQDRLVEFLNAQNFDVVIATATLSLQLSLLAPRLNAKTIGWQHSSYESYFETKDTLFWNKGKLCKQALPNLDAYVVLSAYDVKKIKENVGLDVIDINNPVTVFSDELSKLDKKNFFIGARFEYAKGVDTALEAFLDFTSRDNEWNLIIAGDGGDRNALIRYVWKHDLADRVKFVGVTNDMAKYYRESSIYLMTSRWEGWGLVVTEAFSMGVPVIAFGITPMDLIIDDGVNGVLVEPENVKAFSHAMYELAHDDERRHAMGKAAAEKSKQYSLDAYVARWRDLFGEIGVGNRETCG